MRTREELEARLRLMSTIWLALVGGVVLFAAVTFGLLTWGGLEMDTLPASTITLVAPVLLVLMAVGLIVGHKLEDQVPSDASLEDRLAQYLAARIVALSLQEGPALAVIVLSLLAGTPMWALAAGGVATYTMFLARPRRDAVERIARRVQASD